MKDLRRLTAPGSGDSPNPRVDSSVQRQRLGVIGVQFDVLGTLRIAVGDEVTPVSGEVRRSLLAMLLVHANRPVPADALADALWTERADPTRLHVQVHRLRSMLDAPERLVSETSGYRLCVGPGESDAGRFEALVDAAVDQDPRQAVGTLRDALELWRGEPYARVDTPAVTDEAHRLSERRLDALEALYTAELRNGRHSAISGELDEAADQHPFRERLHALRMTALHRNGRRADALAAYQYARRVLVDELGLEPGPELRAAEQAILDGGSPDLDGTTEPITAVPAQLPQRTAGFVGRAAQLSALDGLLRPVDPVGVMMVVGGGGVGKTSLILSWAHRAKRRFPDGQLYVDLHGFGSDRPVAPEVVLASFLRALGVDGTSIPEDAAERAARFRSLVDGRRLLIVLDNARSAEQVRPLLPGSETCRVVITSRDSLAGLVAHEGAHRIQLERLTAHESIRLLESLVGDLGRAGPGVPAQLAARCAGLPLALRIAAERLRDRPRDQARALVAELSDGRHRLDALDNGDDYMSVRSVFAASYDHLPSAAARVLRFFSIHPGYDMDIAALAALVGTDRRTTRRLIDILVRAHLVEERDSRYALHDLLWSFAADLADATDPPEARKAALGRLLDHYRNAASRAVEVIFPDEAENLVDASDSPAMADFDAGMQWLDAERVNLIRGTAAANGAGRPTYVTDLSRLMTWYLDVSGYLDDAGQLHARALATARELGDRVAEGTALRGLGLGHFRAQRFAESERVTEQALRLHLEADSLLPAATTYNCLGVLYGFMGNTDAAVRALRRSIELYRTDDRWLMMACRPLAGLGLQLRRLGEYEAARHALSEAHTLAVRSGLLITQAHSAYGLAGVLRDTWRLVDALDLAQRAVSLAKRTRFRFLEGLALHRLGTIRERRREYEAASRSHAEAVSVARSTGNTQLLVMAFNGAGHTDTAAGRPEHAAESFGKALDAVAEGGADYEEARACSGLADALEHLGEPDRATEYWERALELFRTLNV